MGHPYDMGDKQRHSVLGPTLTFNGELIANEDLLIEGQIEGSIKHTSHLKVGVNGNVKADINAEYLTIEGKVEGDLHGRASVLVKQTANVTGNITSPSVALQEGSKFSGSVDMSGADDSAAEAQIAGSQAQNDSEQTDDDSSEQPTTSSDSPVRAV